MEARSHATDGEKLDPPTGLQERRYGKDGTATVSHGEVTMNASGHRDQLHRQYGLLGVCGLALTIDSAWIAFGGSLTVAILNGGPPGILYEFIIACLLYTFIGASLAELASAVPSSGGVYHWASITAGPKHGRTVGFFTGSLNFFGWIFALASIVYIPANVVVQMYSLYRPDFVIEPWHTYVAFVLVTWFCTFIIIFFNRIIPYLQHLGLFLVLGGGFVTIVVVASMPARHASNAFVWKDFENATGWSGGVAFLTGVLNGAYAIGTPDAITHLAEELPNPRIDLPKAIFAQIGLGFVTAFVYGIALMYGINDLEKVISSSGSFPLVEVYRQATNSNAATLGLLIMLFLSVMICTLGTLLMVGRNFWTLARDNATPFPGLFSRVNERLSCPIPATLFCSVFCTGLGAISLGSKTAFASLVGSFIILTTASFLLTFLPHILTRRSTVRPGPFWMGNWGYVVNGLSCVLIVMFDVFWCFPYAYPVSPIAVMNWNSVILVGVIFLTAFWWVVHASRAYPGPKLSKVHTQDIRYSL